LSNNLYVGAYKCNLLFVLPGAVRGTGQALYPAEKSTLTLQLISLQYDYKYNRRDPDKITNQVNFYGVSHTNNYRTVNTKYLHIR